ncbi:hypothetical protein BGZ61DRAFT_585835 [Ilyonectria robusta]|uniref:uncharacterized protein n=1 Tax=Ilyonectria robusta TaxID=1079257 RepID=UPI001E8E0B01|nr:uncharacterized protein BGZ61DRAFT_585835 [Ilyonectria robusta]KAH8734201.1 hypothetical protein BGZ61DRAFT_585835 [Ilyonectria robusta]
MDGPQKAADDSYFIVKRDEVAGVLRAEVKPSVTEWIGKLRQQPNCTAFVRRMLDIIETRMLVVDVGERIDAAQFVSVLKEATSQIGTDISDQIPRVAQRMAQRPLPGILGDESQEEVTSVDSRPSNGLPLRNGVRNLRLERLDTTSHKITTFDKLRLRIERHFGHQFDWSPLPPVNRRQAKSEARLIWEYGGQEMSIFLNRHQYESCRNRVHVCNAEILPIANAPQSSSPSTASPSRTTRWQSFCNSTMKVLQCWRRNRGVKCHTAATNPASSPTSNARKESYFCIDKYWTSVKQTNMYTVPSVDLMKDDHQLFLRLRESLTTAQGSWLHRLSSWRTCTGVQLSKFTFLFDNSDLVKAFEQKADGKTRELCKGYEYFPLPDLEFDEHMQLMAETILQGLQKPELGRHGRAVLDGIPKLRAPPGLHKRQYNSGWGFYTTQGFCLVKILRWVGAILSPGVAFVLVWLSLISAVDLQNAFVPMSFLTSLVAIILGIALMFPT